MNNNNNNSQINHDGYLQVDSIHQIYFSVSGNPDGLPVFIIHGGPGGQSSLKSLEFFDLNCYKVIMFDQRGCGKSKPRFELQKNNTNQLVEDIRKLKEHLNIDKMILFGGSWGTTLSLAYAIKYPEDILHLVLRGIFLARQEDVDFLYEKGASFFYPEKHNEFASYVQDVSGNSILEKYYSLLTSDDLEKKYKAGRAFAKWEESIVSINPKLFESTDEDDYQISLMESHYFVNKSFLPSDNYILENAHKIKHIPTDIVHGRNDIDTRPIGAYLLSKELDNCNLYFIEQAGHTQWDINNKNKLIQIFNELKEAYK
ncbi:prolyl aminopeptidase [Mycoplasma sp. 1199]|uniref:prolyl aminopeptidase n=1 Tax=Mycoplasma sp. 1199 TaxID=3108526 RepID=UPI002B1D7176|nr:prolyl aminopeptidase [Mycoplasma sp. 1199]MEA4205950.1 prolyl aminopeptidase [Mycoplasma sp. 1199]